MLIDRCSSRLSTFQFKTKSWDAKNLSGGQSLKRSYSNAAVLPNPAFLRLLIKKKTKAKSTPSPTYYPTESPTYYPTEFPTASPSKAHKKPQIKTKTKRPPTPSPTAAPTEEWDDDAETDSPTEAPTVEETDAPTFSPTASPTYPPIIVFDESETSLEFDDDVMEEIEEIIEEEEEEEKEHEGEVDDQEPVYPEDQNLDEGVEEEFYDPTNENPNEEYKPPDDTLDPVLQFKSSPTTSSTQSEQVVVERTTGVMIPLMVVLMVFTAYQMAENPDGIYASVCRLCMSVAACILRVVLLPFNYLFGNRFGSGHIHIDTPDYREPYRGRHGHVELT